MKFISTTLKDFSNMKDLIDLAKKYDYNTFIKKTDGLTLKYKISI
jgi:hypothetical protein